MPNWLRSQSTTNIFQASKMARLGCHADIYTVSRCRSRGESEEYVVHRRGSMQARESTLALKPKADVTRSSKQRYQRPHEKDLCPPKIFKKIQASNDKRFFFQ